jgi:hypothetical protein
MASATTTRGTRSAGSLLSLDNRVVHSEWRDQKHHDQYVHQQ